MNFLLISTLFAIVTPLIGITAVLKGTFKPQRMTRFLILILSVLFVGTLYAQNDRTGIYIASAQLVGAFAIFLLSLKRGMGGTNRFDFFILFLAIASLIIWQTTQNALLGLIMSVVTDFIAFVPTLVKTWRFPHTEDWRFYMSDVLASTFSLLSIQVLTLATLTFPLYIFLINTTSVFLILSRRHKPQSGK